jgi:lipopolysaccharide biosynthesis glycosyltransferase
MELVYYTVGFNSQYLDLLYLSIQSLRNQNRQDVMVICDTSMIDKCTEKLKNFKGINIVPCPDSLDAMDSSMKKLLIFNYDISKYFKVLFIDSDVLVNINLEAMFNSIHENKLYAGAEHKSMILHKGQWHSFQSYTEDDIKFFYDNKIYPFNCGLFGFITTLAMKQHFSNILEMVNNHTGQYYYEQSFMNVYFNKLNLTDTNVMNESNYMIGIDVGNLPRPTLSWLQTKYHNKIFHFTSSKGSDAKLKDMLYWNERFPPRS